MTISNSESGLGPAGTENENERLIGAMMPVSVILVTSKSNVTFWFICVVIWLSRNILLIKL